MDGTEAKWNDNAIMETKTPSTIDMSNTIVSNRTL